MVVEIDIIDRVFRNIEDFCETNGLDINEYMSNAVMERYNLDKYGDLNDKLVKKEDVKEVVKPVIIEEKTEEIVEEPVKVSVEEKPVDIPVKTEEAVIVQDDKPKRKKRTLKTK